MTYENKLRLAHYFKSINKCKNDDDNWSLAERCLLPYMPTEIKDYIVKMKDTKERQYNKRYFNDCMIELNYSIYELNKDIEENEFWGDTLLILVKALQCWDFAIINNKIILFTGNFGEYRGEGIKIRPRFKYDKFNKLKYRDCVNELKIKFC